MRGIKGERNITNISKTIARIEMIDARDRERKSFEICKIIRKMNFLDTKRLIEMEYEKIDKMLEIKE